MTAERHLLGLIGAKISRSITPAMHEAAARALGFEIYYHLIDTEALGLTTQDLPRMLDGVRALGFTGVNVTHPFKEAVVAHLDAVEGAAAALGSVNTVVLSGSRLVGHNTDYTGFITGWRRAFRTLAPGQVALIGTGGVGRAIAHGLVALGATALLLVDIDARRAQALALEMGNVHPSVAVAVAPDAGTAMKGADGAVNATPIGMYAYPGNPAPAGAFAGLKWAADAIYTPLETEFIVAARRAGAAVMSGQELAIGQAVDAFALFLGRPAPVEAMRAAFLQRTQAAGPARAAI
ncbi:MAG TPA: shikimate dehydrogenase [Alphaproteobacteria bacterium]|nr:shikimate dehydrogenase [Alphaproteobacteria bacterium]